MNIASLINPKCSQPIFSMDSIETAYTCGNISGKIVAGILTLIIVVICLVLSTKTVTTVDTVSGKTTVTKKPNYLAFGISAFLLSVIWIGIPNASGWINSRRWSGYNEEIESLMKQGLSRKEALSSIQSLFQQNIQSSAILNSSNQNTRPSFNFNLNK